MRQNGTARPYFRLNQTLDRQDTGVTMPPQGLILTKINY